MQIKLLALLIVVCASAACAPDKKCSGQLVYDDATDTCGECPKDATFKDGTCICKAGYNFVANTKCGKGDAGVVDAGGGGDEDKDSGPASDAGSKMSSGGGATCQDYCAFNNTCIGMNALVGALGTLSTDLHAKDTAACETSCKSDLGSKEAGDEALACFKTKGADAMCSDPNPQNGLKAAFGVIGECCGPRGSDPLCKSICTTLKGNPVIGSMIDFCP